MAALALARKTSVAIEAKHVVAFVDDAATRDAVSRALQETGMTDAAILDGGIAAALKQVEPGGLTRVLIADVSASATPVADVAALSAVIDPGTRLVVIGTVNDVALFRDLLGVGAVDYLVKPINPQMLHAALLEGEPGFKSKRGPAQAGRIVAFIGARGGVGATTVAVNTAWLLAHDRKQKTALVDLDIHFGTAPLLLDLEPGRGLREALERPERIDTLFVDRAMVKAGERLFVLGGEEPLNENPPIDPRALDVLLTELRQNFGWVVLDMPRTFLLGRPQAISAANDIVLVSDLSLVGIRDTLRILEIIKATSPDARVKLAAVNPDGSRPKVDRADFERSVGHKLDYDIPFDAKVAAAGANGGKPVAVIARGSRLTKSLQRISVDLAGGNDRKGASLLTRWLRR
ncbi:MAG TPA: AAA family ATPase [Alphaproteobacteria bacterium]